MNTNLGNKVVGVGMQKTGTTSLSHALEILGYSSYHFAPEMISRKWYDEGAPQHEIIDFNLEHKLDLLDKHDSITDNPVCLFKIYEDIDRKYPNSKFILTTRSLRKWVRSVTTHVNQEYYKLQLEKRIRCYKDYDPKTDILYTCDNIGLLEYIYQVPYLRMGREAFVDKFMDHKQEVFDYFADREDKLLVLNLERGEGWKELCAFLDKPIPSVEFPHKKKTVYRKRIVRRIVRSPKRIYQLISQKALW